MKTQTCTACNEEKPKTEEFFYKRNDNHFYRQCKDCKTTQQKNWSHRNLERHSFLNRRSRLTVRFGISKEEAEQLIARTMSDNCEICGSKETNKSGVLSIDHCHKSAPKDSFRGLLCHNCNVLIGHSLDNTDILRSAIKYLDKHQQQLAA